MTDEDKLQVLYNYIKMIEPNIRVYLDNNGVSVDGSGSLYMKIYCNGSKFAAQSSGLNCDWLHKIFKVYMKVAEFQSDIADYRKSLGL